MYAQRLTQKHVVAAYRVASRAQQLRRLATAPPPEAPRPTPSSKPYRYEKAEPERSWVVQKIRANPFTFKIVRALVRVMGYGSTKQVAGRRTLAMYEQVCAVKASEDRIFWQEACDLPPTFQSWFTITNLHVWLLTARLRALPQPHGTNHIQGLIDHFFMDVEDRIRAVLQPIGSETLSQTDFYAPPPTSDYASTPPAKKKRGKAPDKLVKQQMQILKEQWAGLGMSLDLGLAMGDAEMAGAVWRNLLGARGARGIPYNTSPGFRRSINPLTGRKMSAARLKLLERDFESKEAEDDNSGVADYSKDQLDKYVAYPELMVDIVAYIYRELKRLEGVGDDDVLGISKELGREGRGVEVLKFGKVRQ
ncbi:hypothetical protein BDM02DRAFT_3117313 [Thelephora ganbajun]|uniref:Uncharacterized protein n=1 Tax=Thelephora ganbajun TaxID=370292 RepID=A0ACB6ZCL0_THEGA|nr:hypothetical protein BDM02DRAFT_3117313 [Thelephora ganbajun]